ncbi:MAG: heavy metal translocating P-type ATPase [Limisphaerales bacterium]
MMRSTVETKTPAEHCAYCDAPLPADSLVGRPRHDGFHPQYCCYGCRLLSESGQKTLSDLSIPETTWFKIGIGAVIAGQAMLLGLAVNLASPEGAIRILLHASLIVSAVAVFAVLGFPLLRAALESLRRKQITIELLFLAGIFGAFGASLHSTFTGVGAVYYEIVAILLTVYTVGKTLGARSRARAVAESRRLRDTFDSCRLLRPDGSTITARAVEIKPGDRIQVFPGEPVPIDGRIVSGQAFVRETPLTGEPFPVVRRAGDEVFAGSYSEDGELIVLAGVSGDCRRLDGLLSMVETARDVPSAIQAQADRIVRWFLPLVLAIAVGTFVFWSVKQRPAFGLFNALAVLLVACPCAMGLATPLGLWNALAVLASRGLAARSGDFIDRLAGVTQVVFDKTGTLSEERLSLVDFACAGDAEQRRELLEIIRAVQARCPHPVARAFVPNAVRTLPSSIKIKSVKTLPARGIEAWVEAEKGQELHLRIGQRELMSDLSAELRLLQTLRHSPQDHLVYVAVDGRLQAIAAVRERLRDSTNAAVAALENLGVTVTVMTGDRQARAEELGLPNPCGGLTPVDKAAAVTALRHAGQQIGFVGDGVNDAPALSAASVGIALDHGAGITTASADAVLHGGDLRIIPWAVTLCRQVRASIWSNLLFAAAYNVVGVALAAAGWLHPVVAALLMVGSSAIVSWRALRGTQAAACCASTVSESLVLSSPVNDSGGVRSRASRRFGSIRLLAGGTSNGFSVVGLRPATIYGILVALQGPFIAWLGRLSPLSSGIAVLTGLALGLGMASFRARNPEVQRYAAMTFAMLGPGNWGMLLGWWIDAGFSPVVQNGVCLCCTAHHYFGAGGFKIPWMYVGMLIFGLPPMLGDPTARARGPGRFWLAMLSGVGMVVGMVYGGDLAARWAAPTDSFLPALAGMTAGMLLGMFCGCDLGRVVACSRQRHGL